MLPYSIRSWIRLSQHRPLTGRIFGSPARHRLGTRWSHCRDAGKHSSLPGNVSPVTFVKPEEHTLSQQDMQVVLQPVQLDYNLALSNDSFPTVWARAYPYPTAKNEQTQTFAMPVLPPTLGYGDISWYAIHFE